MRRIFFTVIFILFASPFPEKSYAQDNFKTVVVFFSLDVNLPAYHNFMDGFTGHYSETPVYPYNIIYEYIDINRYPHENDIESVINQYKEKYKSVNVDLLITFGPGTFSLLKKYGFDAKNNSTIVNIDIESNILSTTGDPLFDNENALHISIKTDYGKTLKTAFELFPEYREVYIISGSSPADRYFAELTKMACESFRDSHNFNFIQGKTLDSTLVSIREIPLTSIVFLTSFIEDVNGIPYSTSMVSRITSEQCDAPLFSLSDDFVEGKTIGGYVYSFIELGRQIERIVEELLKGRPLNKITVDENSFNKHMYDWQMLKKWDLLDSKVIPADSEFFNKDVNLLLEYRWYFLGAVLFLLTQTILILYLIRMNKKQKGVAKQRIENELLFRELAREDRLSRMSELTASLSHELNQPLTAILYNAQAGKRFTDAGKLDDKQAIEIFNNIIEDDKRAGSLISSVRSLMKLEERKKERVNLNNLILETENLFHSESVAKHIQISLKLQEHPVFVYGDKIQLQQVILNLLFNAANSMEMNSSGNKKIEILQQLDGGDVTVSICDSGSGFEDSLKETLFNSFVTSRVKGLGIGLAVSKTIIESHHGVIWAENLPEGGAEFSFKLPLFDDKKR